MSLSQLTSDIEGKTAKDLADMATEQDTVEFLAKCQTGLVPDVAPKKKEREAIQHKEIVVPAGEEGCQSAGLSCLTSGWGPG